MDSKRHTLSESDIIAQAVVFFSAGFETTASTLTHAIYELAQHPELQDRLHEEVVEVVKGLDRQDNMDAYCDAILNNAPYLEAVIKETLRKYPSLVRLERRVGGENVKLGGIPLDKDVLIEIPTVSVHHDPDYYPEPDRFNPDRFMPENKHLLVPYTYLPFGAGPRNCVGVRFAYQEIKLCLAAIVRLFHFDVTPNTPRKLSFKNGNPLMNAHEFPIKVSRRQA